jgi:uncharacterized protein YbaP (TraB family)
MKLLRFLSLLLLALFGATSVQAASALWKVSGADGKVLYLGGSIHVLKAEVAMPKSWDTAFNAAETLVFESDLEAQQKPEYALRLLQHFSLPKGKTLKTETSPEIYQQLVAAGKEVGLPVEAMQNLQPILVVITLTQLKLDKLGYQFEDGVDLRYLKRAQAAGKALAALETEEDFFRFMNAPGYQEEIVRKEMKDWDDASLRAMMDRFEATWQTGDLEKFKKDMEDWKKEYPHFFQIFITNRNQAWLPKLEAWLATPETEFVIVGLGHFYGAEGLLEHLRAKGYRVEQMP